MSYIKNILVSIDQVGNAIAGGNPDCTVSGRTGYFQYNAVKPYVWYWHLLAFVIDLTFYPFDGHGHCKQAKEKEQINEFNDTGNLLLLFLLSIITLGSCICIMPISWTFFLINKLLKK